MRFTEKTDGSLAFTPEEVADGKLTRFINVLMENGCEIRLGTDGYCWIVEYISTPDLSGKAFQVVEEDEVVVDGKYVDWETYDADGKEN